MTGILESLLKILSSLLELFKKIFSGRISPKILATIIAILVPVAAVLALFLYHTNEKLQSRQHLDNVKFIIETKVEELPVILDSLDSYWTVDTDAIKARLRRENSAKCSDFYAAILDIENIDQYLTLQVYKHDNLAYFAVIIAAFSNVSSRSLAWCDSTIKHAKLALDITNRIKQAGSDMLQNERSLNWLRNAKTEDRMRYIIAWALAVKRNNGNSAILIADIEYQIRQIKNPVYLEWYPLKENADFRRLEDEYGEQFIQDFFN